MNTPLVAVLMGSASDWDTMEKCSEMLTSLGIAHESQALSAHRTPDAVVGYVTTAEKNGVEVFIAAAGGAAHLAGVVASRTVRPVLGVPIESKSLKGMDSLLSTVQMPGGVPVGTLAIGEAGAKNAAILAAEILALHHPEIDTAVRALRKKNTEEALKKKDVGSL